MTRKRFIKLLMANGTSRNMARMCADAVVSLKREEDLLASVMGYLKIPKNCVPKSRFPGITGTYESAFADYMSRLKYYEIAVILPGGGL